MMTRALVLAVACLAAATRIDAAEIVTVTLVGGGKVTGPLLRQNDDGVVVDLGFEVVQIPAKRVLAVTSEDTSGRREEGETESSAPAGSRPARCPSSSSGSARRSSWCAIRAASARASSSAATATW